jgi:hypothetical protein
MENIQRKDSPRLNIDKYNEKLKRPRLVKKVRVGDYRMDFPHGAVNAKPIKNRDVRVVPRNPGFQDYLSKRRGF